MAILDASRMATISLRSRGLRGFLARLASCAEEIALRRRLRAEMATLSARDLRDIGLDRVDVAALDHLPLATPVAAHLRRRRARQSANW